MNAKELVEGKKGKERPLIRYREQVMREVNHKNNISIKRFVHKGNE